MILNGLTDTRNIQRAKVGKKALRITRLLKAPRSRSNEQRGWTDGLFLGSSCLPDFFHLMAKQPS